uniref:Integrase_H2C2 domain-containing protein n=1 Tax=Syphacia muris TaxID=451379 RepID=A0A0N5AXK0_9BILA
MESFAFPSPEKNPIYIPRDHPLVKQLVLDVHERSGHMGSAHTTTEFRSKYWIERIRTKVKQIIKENCSKCRRFLFSANFC